jgi:hypothetical protein
LSGFPITPEMKAQTEMLKRKAAERVARRKIADAAKSAAKVVGSLH